MRVFRFALFFLLLISCGGPPGECANPNDYRVLALVDGIVVEHRDARIVCTGWSQGCNDDTAKPGTDPVYPGNDCECLSYSLQAGAFRLDFPPSEVGDVIWLEEGEMTITKKINVATTCAQGNHYTDYAGTFEGSFGGRTYQRGVFYALETK